MTHAFRTDGADGPRRSGDGRLGPRGADRQPAGRRGPDRGAATRRPRSSTSSARAPTARPGWSASSPGWSPGEPPAPGAGRRPGRLGAGQRRRVRDPARADRRQAHRRRSAPDRASTAAVGSRVTGAEVGGVLGFLASQGARPVRPVPRPRRPAAAGRAEHRPRRARARRRPARLPALGVPARGDPPRAVHRGAVDARAPVRRRSGSSPRPWSRPGCSRTASPGSLEGLKNAAAAARGGGLLDVVGTPEQKEILDRLTGVMSLLEGHADVVMDGVGPTVIPSRGEDPRASSTSAARASACSTGCCAGCSASTPRWRSTATAPKFVRAVVDKAGMAGFNAVWEQPEHLPSRGRDRRPRRLDGARARTEWPADSRRRLRDRRRSSLAVAAGEPPPVRRRAAPCAGPAEPPARARARSPAPAEPTRWRCCRPPSSRATSWASG